MLMLMDMPWLLVVLGGGLMVWGNGLMGFGWRDWIELGFQFPFSLFSEDTSREKEEVRQQKLDEAAAANPGCFILLAGVIVAGYGLFRWFA